MDGGFWISGFGMCVSSRNTLPKSEIYNPKSNVGFLQRTYDIQGCQFLQKIKNQIAHFQ